MGNLLLKNIIRNFFITMTLSMYFTLAVNAGECKTECFEDGSCMTSCASETPRVTPPPELGRSLGNSNSCKYAYDGECDDISYDNARSSVCEPRTDETDCHASRR